jgi:hypothetical protein
MYDDDLRRNETMKHRPIRGHQQDDKKQPHGAVNPTEGKSSGKPSATSEIGIVTIDFLMHKGREAAERLEMCSKRYESSRLISVRRPSVRGRFDLKCFDDCGGESVMANQT